VSSYYREQLSGSRLRRCYEVASPRVRRYLEAETAFLLDCLQPGDSVLELGCGYGRVTSSIARKCRFAVGIDNAPGNISLALELWGGSNGCAYLCMDALHSGFADGSFDSVACIQNGICAFGVDRQALLREALRITKPGGSVMVSTYSDGFWQHRLAWFEAQAAEGLLGPLDYGECRDGVIACTDGFRSGRLTPGELGTLCDGLGVEAEITEVDGSSVFCRMTRSARGE
jgi:2-polyprenyl-6-hydroxyphenyl methylase/3-demethylubiquinone-9 3-methyltransferase